MGTVRKPVRIAILLLVLALLASGLAGARPVLAQEGSGAPQPGQPVPPATQGGSGTETAVQPQTGVPGPQTVIYNLYATDTFVKMADGSLVYNYGFVGGRQGKAFTFQKSFLNDGSGGDNDTRFGGGPPSPSGGPITPPEFKLQGNAQFPAPVIYANAGDVVEIHLKNLGTSEASAPNDPHSIHLHGLDVNAANDGVPETSIAAVPANLCEDGNTAPKGQNCSDSGRKPAPGAGNVVVYMFSPKTAGTYFYHCHQEADIHVQMGMYGALVVYNRTDAAASVGPGQGKGGNLFGWDYDKDYLMFETEIDVRQHCSEQGTYADGICPDIPTTPGQTDGWNPVDYHPQFWFINGLSFPQTIHVTGGAVKTSWANWSAAHPGYDPFITGSISTRHANARISNGDKVLIRLINMGYEVQPQHFHGYHLKVLGSDQRAWPWANAPTGNGLWGAGTPWGQGMEKNTMTVGSGEEYDLLLNMSGQVQQPTSTYYDGSQTRYNSTTNAPASNKQTANPAIPVDLGDPIGISAYIGGPQVNGSFYPESVTGPVPYQLFPVHNHDDYKATNNGTYPGGMFTMIMPTP
jgi:manganese oxidase